MFCDAVRGCFVESDQTEDYRYVGLGHWQFVDFELMRREVGVRPMVSIERDTDHQARLRGEQAFRRDRSAVRRCVRAAAGRSRSDAPTIAWLDYTAKLNSAGLRDHEALVEQLPAGSVVAATFNCHPDREDERLDALERKL